MQGMTLNLSFRPLLLTQPSVAMTDTVVHTIDARGNVLLEVMQGYFGLSSEQMRREIVAAVDYVTEALQLRGIRYADLRAALTPQSDRQEVALFFDTLRIDDSWYGLQVQRRLLPLLNPKGSHSVLVGDLLGSGQQQHWIREQLLRNVHPGKSELVYQHSTQFYCVYLNNCSAEMVRALHEGLSEYPPYVGYADVTYASSFKTYLSLGLTNGYIKFRGTIIQPHEEDLPDDTNQNTLGYPFEKFGLRSRSISDMYYGLLLSYKIERPVVAGFVNDQLHALNAVTSNPIDVADCEIEIEDRKLEYLYAEKTGTMRRLGILGQPKGVLESLIRAKLRSNYLYNMRFRPDYSVATFNILLELEAVDTGSPVRVVSSFAYEQDRNAIRLVTLF